MTRATRFAAMTLAGMLLVSTSTAWAGLIEIGPPFPGVAQVDFYEPVGQSFTAIDANISAGLYFGAINPNSANTDPIQYDLYSGQGTVGPLLASANFSLATGFVGFRTVDFSAVSLSIGNVYSLVASVVGTSPHWGIRYQMTDVYAGGSPVGGPASARDFGIRVAGVPEPTSVALLGVGLAALGFLRRRA